MSLCKTWERDPSFLMWLLQTTALSLALVTAGAAGVRAETVVVQGDDGANAPDGFNLGGSTPPGGDGGSVTANAGSVHPITSPLNAAGAIGGNGGNGGANSADTEFSTGGNGGNGGSATATAATAIASGPAEADATAFGGNGGDGGRPGGCVQWKWRGWRRR